MNQVYMNQEGRVWEDDAGVHVGTREGSFMFPKDVVMLGQVAKGLSKAAVEIEARSHPLAIGREALKVALEEMTVGAGERGENNMGEFVEKYLHDLCEAPANWCAGFVSWCYFEAAKRMGFEMPFKYTVGARSLLSSAQIIGQRLELPEEPGDVVVWYRGSRSGWMGHVGMLVEKISDSKNRTTYRIVEGNKGNFPSKVKIYNYTHGELIHDHQDYGYLGAGRFIVRAKVPVE